MRGARGFPRGCGALVPGVRGGIAVAVACLAAGACAGGSAFGPANPAPWDPESVAFAPSLGVALAAMERRPSGLYVEELAPGDGAEARRGSEVTLHYVGYLADGTVVDRTEDGDPVRFRLGQDPVIRGWTEGAEGMRVGGVRRLVVRPSLGYGNRGQGPVPPNATLIFDVRLLAVR